MTDCSSLQGSTSSSSDAMSSRGGSKNSVTSGNPRIRIIRMLRPNARRIILGPENSIGFGFAIRGGKEFGTGFFVSKVDKGSEADLRGLRIGDQIVRVNGYHVDDAVHKELTQFISYQDRLTLKVRGVGMLPIKEKTLDPLTWHIVPRHALATTLTVLDEQINTIGKDVRIVLKVAPKTKLGLGICKGPEWKPGIFVQFTKEFSVARESGLRPGDQILTCNSIDFSDVLFSEAVAVMKSSNILEMIIRTGAGLELFPGESSGYNSSASSITGDQSPCWADQSAKRLSMVREEPTISQTKHQWSMDGNSRCNLDRRKTITGIPNSALNQIMHSRHNSTTATTTTTSTDETNKTIIQLSDSGTLINNTIVSNASSSASNIATTNTHVNNYGNVSDSNNGHLSSTNMSTTFYSPDINNTITTTSIQSPQQQQQQQNDAFDYNDNEKSNNNKIADICFVSRQSETKTVIVEVHRSDNDENTKLNATNFDQQLQQFNQGQHNYIENNISNSNNNNSGQPIYGKIQRNNNTNINTCPKPPPPQMINMPIPTSSTISNGLTNSKSIVGSPSPTIIQSSSQYTTADNTSSGTKSTSTVSSVTNNGHHHHERSPSVTSSITNSGGTSLSSAISEELKKRKERHSQNPNQKFSIEESVANSKQQQQQSKRFGNPSLGGNDARHTALMDEFKAAHRRMFRSGTEMESLMK